MTAVLFGAVREAGRGRPAAEAGARRVDWAALRRLIGLGGPAGFQILLEVGVFAAATALAGRLAPAALAAHQIAMNLWAFVFMCPSD